jgi:hypothetical protein
MRVTEFSLYKRYLMDRSHSGESERGSINEQKQGTKLKIGRFEIATI